MKKYRVRIKETKLFDFTVEAESEQKAKIDAVTRFSNINDLSYEVTYQALSATDLDWKS